MSSDADPYGGAEAVHCPPVLFLIFNRPDLTARVFERIREAQPRLLFVAADGPRADRDGEVELCAATRAIVDHGVDWDCEVKRLYRDANLGCKIAVSSAIDWFFANVEEGIILEDDCVPDLSFFPFCEQLLNRYRDDERIVCISGSSFQQKHAYCTESYYFSIYNHWWGWATWRRAWARYDVSMKSWAGVADGNWLENWIGTPEVARYWRTFFTSVYNGSFDTWDAQWALACWLQHGLSIVPNGNLVSNIGCGVDATHTFNRDAPYSNLTSYPMTFPLIHPELVIRNYQADVVSAEMQEAIEREPTMRMRLRRLKHRAGRLIKGLFSLAS